MKFKAEIVLLLAAIGMFVFSAFLYTFQPASESLTFRVIADFPYRIQALISVVFGSVLMIIASVSYSKRSKNFGRTSHRF